MRRETEETEESIVLADQAFIVWVGIVWQDPYKKQNISFGGER